MKKGYFKSPISYSSIATGPICILFIFVLPVIITPLLAQQAHPDRGDLHLVKDFKQQAAAAADTSRFRLASGTLYDKDRPALHRTAVKVVAGQEANGSGAVISDDGLILTSHFVAMQALSQLSTPRRNIIEKGFSAGSEQEEIPLQNYRLLVPIKQLDVTRWITSRIPDDYTYQDSIKQLQELQKQLVKKYRTRPDQSIQLNEMYGGNRFLLSIYRRISDVRLVQVPSIKIAQLRGTDSYHRWPRYSGSYALLRAYVSPDGTSRAFNRSNRPWNPDISLSINPKGLQTDTTYGLLSYPGSTFRTESSYAYQYYQRDLNPYIEASLVDIIDGLKQAALADPSIALDNHWKRSNLQRSLRYYEGVKWGFAHYDIIDQKKQMEKEFAEWVKEDSLRQLRYRRVLPELKKSFRIASHNSPILYTSLYAINHNKLLQIARLYYGYYNYAQHPDSLSYSARQRDGTLRRHRQLMESMSVDDQVDMLRELIVNFYELPARNQLPLMYTAFDTDSKAAFRKSVESFLKRQREQSVVFDTSAGRTFLNTKPADIPKGGDSLLVLFESIYNGFKVGRKNHTQHQPYLKPARRLYIEGIHRMRSDSLEKPEADGTLRISTGQLSVWESPDTLASPYTTLSDLIAYGEQQDAKLPDFIREWEKGWQNQQSLTLDGHDITLSGKTGFMPISGLTTHDLSDGSSGGPIISGDGSLAGVTLETNFKGIIGDFYIDPGQRRAINLDIRYILALIDHYDKANHIVPSLSLGE